jgi:hypothetical protein
MARPLDEKTDNSFRRHRAAASVKKTDAQSMPQARRTAKPFGILVRRSERSAFEYKPSPSAHNKIAKKLIDRLPQVRKPSRSKCQVLGGVATVPKHGAGQRFSSLTTPWRDL